ncbi:hypothetical protein F511_43140 [Dorcoceras hygrometricum]|uniref:Uncharacterized protein n=1 Tax=Dorcoceras hygrometricum TaxID=472368 RepID=A0A2Z7B711_9LAMI|nr:hypothetical protein F511_43140 [Dorcoceras hygrometricum]
MGIDQLELHSVQLGYLKILKMGNTDPNNTKAGKQIREPVSPSQLGGRHSNLVVTTPMIALDFSSTTHQSASHNVAFNQIHKARHNQLKQVSLLLLRQSHRDSLEFESVPEYFSTLKRGLNLARNHLPKNAQHPKNALPDFSRNLRTPAASRSIPQVVLQSLMGNNWKSKPQGVQRHPNRRKQRLESTGI